MFHLKGNENFINRNILFRCKSFFKRLETIIFMCSKLLDGFMIEKEFRARLWWKAPGMLHDLMMLIFAPAIGFVYSIMIGLPLNVVAGSWCGVTIFLLLLVSTHCFGVLLTTDNAVGVVCAFFPGGIAISGMIGTITATVGLASAICSITRSMLVRVSLKNGKNVYVYIS